MVDANFIIRHEVWERRITSRIFNALSSTISSYPLENTIPLTNAYTSALRVVMRAEVAYLWQTFLLDLVGVQEEAITDLQIELFIQSIIPALVAEVLQTTVERARKQPEITQEYINSQRARARSLARTITTTAMMRSLLIDLKASGLTWQKAWVAERDDRTRESHRLTNPKFYIPIDSPFVVGGEQLLFPTDPSFGAGAGNIVNCRCHLDFKVVAR